MSSTALKWIDIPVQGRRRAEIRSCWNARQECKEQEGRDQLQAIRHQHNLGWFQRDDDPRCGVFVNGVAVCCWVLSVN